MATDNRTVVITGASGGIGLAAARRFSLMGCRVYGISRREYNYGDPKIRHIIADVSDKSSIVAAFDEIYREAGGIDVLVNNAGFGISGAVEFTAIEDAKAQFDVNLFGMLACVQQVLPHMRQCGGVIINISSVAAMLPIPYQAFYSASKSAINSVTIAMANELRPFPVKVAALMPGDIKTGFTSARKKEPAGSDVYKRMERSVSRMERDEQNGMSPDVIARRLYSISKKKSPKPLYSCGIAYQAFCVLSGLLPKRFITWALGKLYS